MWWLVVTVSVPSGLSDLIVLGVCCLSSVLSRAFVMRSPLELIITQLLGDDFSHLRPLPTARPGCPVPPVVEGWHLGQPLLPHSTGRDQEWDHLRANQGFGVFWFIPPLLVVVYFPPISFIWRISPVCPE